MKTVVLFISCIFMCLPAKANTHEKLESLKLGDWFTLEFVLYLDNLPSGDIAGQVPWRAENLLKIEFTGSVIRKTRNTVSLSFKPTHFYSNWIGGNKDSNNYFDSYFSALDPKDNLGIHDSLITELNLVNGSLKDTTFALQQKIWKVTSQEIPTGMHKRTNLNSQHWTTMEWDAHSIFKSVVLGYLENWQQTYVQSKEMPQSIPVKHPYYSPAEVRLTGASFPLAPNIKITYAANETFTDDQLRISINNDKITQDKTGFISYTCFLPSPASLLFAGIPLNLTPGDSIHIENGPNNTYIFSGKGFGNCSYADAISKQEPFFYKDYNYFFNLPTPAEVETRLKEGTAIYNELWEKYAGEMTPYWLHSSKLSYNYWYASLLLRVNYLDAMYGKNTQPSFPIPWEKEQFATVTPFTDYLYNPKEYTKFMDVYVQYKATQLTEDNLTGLKSYWGDYIENYYLQKQILDGYPRFVQMAHSLSNVMLDKHLSVSEREYNDFVSLCLYPELRHDITRQHRELMKVEPGANIKSLDMQCVKYLPLKDKVTRYILFSVSPMSMSIAKDIENLTALKDSLANMKLSEIVNIYIVRPSGYKELLPENMKTDKSFIFLDEQTVSKDLAQLPYRKPYVFLLRNDGTILSRELNLYDPLPDRLKSSIEQDMKHPQKAKISFADFLWAIAAILVINLTIILIVRYQRNVYRKKERNKRLITELELKAIRSQMNPHFIFNALGSIQNLIKQSRNDKANEYLINFAKLLRMVLSSSEKKLIALSEEVEQLTLYLKLEQLRLPFEYSIVIEDGVDLENEEVPGMLIQPLVENAIIHGIAPKGTGSLTINMSKENTILYVSVLDTGIGFSDAALKSGFGLRAVNERLNLLNHEFKTSIGLKIENKQDTGQVSGSCITISIPT